MKLKSRIRRFYVTPNLLLVQKNMTRWYSNCLSASSNLQISCCYWHLKNTSINSSDGLSSMFKVKLL